MFTISKKLLAAALGATAISLVSGAMPAMAQSKPEPNVPGPITVPKLVDDARYVYWSGINDIHHCRTKFVQSVIDEIEADKQWVKDYMDRWDNLIKQSKEDPDWPTDNQRINDVKKGYRNAGYEAWHAVKLMEALLADLEKMPPCVVTPPPSQVSPGPVPQTPTQLDLPVLPLPVLDPPIRIEDTFPDHPRHESEEKTGTDRRSHEKVDTGDRREEQSNAHRVSESR